MNRYARNLGALTQTEQQTLQSAAVCVVGLGGLGGYAAELLARLGIGTITGIDADVFDTTNLNRQLFADETVLGEPKAFAARERLRRINPDTIFNPVQQHLTADNAVALLQGHTLIVDALDSAEDRRTLSRACTALRVPLIHGAVEGWCGQVALIGLGDDTMDRLYPDGHPVRRAPPVLSFTPATVAGFQVSLAVRVLLGHPLPAAGTVYFLDLSDGSVNAVRL